MINKKQKNISIFLIGLAGLIIGLSQLNIGNNLQYYNLAQDYYFYYLKDYKQSLSKLEQRYDLQIEYIVTPTFIDEVGRSPPQNGMATQIDEIGLARYARLLPQVLAQYPTPIVKNNINIIKLSANLKFYGVTYGGTNFDDMIYLSDKTDNHRNTDFFVRQVFHHEFSSILMRKYNFPLLKWISANPPGFSYNTNGLEQYINSVENDTDLQGYEYYYKKGVIAKYGLTDFENDFNLYAQMVFNEPERLSILVHKFPALRKKYEIVKEFYLSISREFQPVFDEIDKRA